MMNIAESLLRAGVAVVRIPVGVVADVVTTVLDPHNSEESHTVRATRDLVKNLEDAAKPRNEEGN
ncbi:MAG: hypothetical protein ACK5XN_17495 [Bacteroidota bacterium]|jgi:hypothetical protein